MKNFVKMETVEIGDSDPMSIAAGLMGVELCGAETPIESRYAKCSRIKGHTEGEGSNADHVATVRPGFQAVAVWRS